EITVFEDRSFTFITKTPPAAVLIKEAIKISKGSGEPHVNKVGTISQDQIRAIAERKMPDLNANDLDAASKIIAGTARSMGVDVKGEIPPWPTASDTASSTTKSTATAPTRRRRRSPWSSRPPALSSTRR